MPPAPAPAAPTTTDTEPVERRLEPDETAMRPELPLTDGPEDSHVLPLAPPPNAAPEAKYSVPEFPARALPEK